jgi:hypothetical protein
MTLRFSSRSLATLVASVALLAGLAGAQPEPWCHPDGTIHYYNATAVPGGISWNAAFDSARALGGDLATLTSPAEESLVFGLVDHNQYWYTEPGSGKLAGPWLGGYQPAGAREPDFGWQWITGEPFGFRDWTEGAPDNVGGHEDALSFGGSQSGRVRTWNDLVDTDDSIRGFVTELSADTTSVGLTQITPDTAPGYSLFDCLMGNYTYLIDNKGRLINSWRSTYGTGSSVYLLPNGYLLRNDNINPPTFRMGGRVEIMDWDGKVVWGYTYSTSTHCCHHDGIMLPNGHVLLTAWELKTRTQAIAAGRNPAKTPAAGLWPEHLIEIDTATDSIVWEWHMWDHLVQDYDATKPNYGSVANHSELLDLNYTLGAPAADWVHMNALDYNAKFDQIIMSAHNFNEVWVIDHSTTTQQAAGHTGGRQGMGGDILYRWGNPRTYRAGTAADQRFYLLHSSRWIGEGLPGAGHIMVFNNGQNRPDGNYSSVEEWIPPVDSSGRYQRPAPGTPFGPASTSWYYAGTPKSSFYSFNVSGAQRLPNGNTLMCIGAQGRFLEVKPDSSIVWYYVNPVANGNPVHQGDTVPMNPAFRQNIAFRVERYPADYPGLVGKDLTPGMPLELYLAPAAPPPGPLSPADREIVGTLTPTLHVGTIPNFHCDSFHFRLYARGGTTPIQEAVQSGNMWTVAQLVAGEYEWDCQAWSADGWTPYFSPRWNLMAVNAPSGWSASAPMPAGSFRKSIRDGGWLAYDISLGRIYAAKSNRTGEFYAYDPVKDSWSTMASWPNGAEAKPPRAGAAGCSDGSGTIYATKGNNTPGFWRYDATSDSWHQLKSVPLGASNKRVKGGTDIVWAYKGTTGSPYLLKGYKNEFYRYDVATDEWQTLVSAPVGSHPKWDKGSWLASDGGRYIYAFKAKYHEFYKYDVENGVWLPALTAMPVPGSAGNKKTRDGGCGAYDNGRVYAFKGGNTSEFWQYTTARDSWAELEAIPSTAPGYLQKKKVKAGADIVAAGTVLYATKGNKSLEFWRYGLPLAMGSEPAGRSGAMSGIARLPGRLALNIAPNPIRNRAVIAYSVPMAGPVSLKLYDVSGSLVKTLAGGHAGAGSHTARLDAAGLPRGVYLLGLESGESRVTKKLILE